MTKTGNANMAEIYNQTLMMLAHDLYVLANLPLPEGALPPTPPSPWSTHDEAPF